MPASHRPSILAAATLAAAVLAPVTGAHAQSWPCYGGNPQHTANSAVPTQPLRDIRWQAPVDLQPQYSGNVLFIHYGAPLATPANSIVVPVKIGVADSFRVDVRRGSDGAQLWSYDPDYRLAPGFAWTPSYGPALRSDGRLVAPAGGGTVLVFDQVDTPGPHVPVRVAFYGTANHDANPSAFDADVQICSPLTPDSHGRVYFGFRATGANPLGLTNGIARVDPNGTGVWVAATVACNEPTGAVTAMNCAPALSNDEGTLYVAMRRIGAIGTSPRYLVALDANTLATRRKVQLFDPYTTPQTNCSMPDDGTASPMVAPDGHVFYGVLERPFATNGQRGWLLQFDSTLTQIAPPGAFGWDDTPTLVPAAHVPSYTGGSPYLLMTKYNNYANSGNAPCAPGDGVNQLAVIDPTATAPDPRSGRTVLKPALLIAGVTPDPNWTPWYPNAVTEWCINTAAYDPFKKSVLAGSEDGVLYRWDLASNSFTESLRLTPGLGEAYTPTTVGPDGTVYAINNATLFAVGVTPGLGVPVPAAGGGLVLEAPRPQPSGDVTTLAFTLPHSAGVDLSIVDAAGRRIARLAGGTLAAGAHTVRWDGRDTAGRAAPAGVYFVRLAADGRTVTRRLVLAR